MSAPTPPAPPAEALATWYDFEPAAVCRALDVASGRFNRLMLAAIALTFLVTTIPGRQRIFDTTDVDGDPWRVCLIIAVVYAVLAEVGNVVSRRFDNHNHNGGTTHVG